MTWISKQLLATQLALTLVTANKPTKIEQDKVNQPAKDVNLDTSDYKPPVNGYQVKQRKRKRGRKQ